MAMIIASTAIDDGQIEDAPEVLQDARPPHHAYIDTYDSKNDNDPLNWSDSSKDGYGSEEIDETWDENRVEDEDWENAERDFTKQYNRLRQHVAVRTGNAQGILKAHNQSVAVASLPAVNHPRSATISSSSNPLSKSATSLGKDRTSDQLAALAKYNSRLAKIDVPYIMGVGVNRKGPSAHANLKDKSDRATNEQVLDPRTRLILFKMIGRGLIHEVNGCVSTGKEANVYHALTPEGIHLALKIYKTSILIFKDRDKYVTGEFRFRRGYSRNPRKMVRLWAEKEMRNLKRLVAAGIRAPDPIEVRENVLPMTFVGNKDGWASPRLKDASLPTESITPLYIELVMAVRRMFHVCKLVHADLSEYNILYHEEHLWIIDVSQSVEHDHPAAFDFLRNDIKNMEDFFGRLGVRCLGLRRCFDFVTKAKLCEDDGTSDEDVLKRWLEEETTDICEDESGKGINLEGSHSIDPESQRSEDAQHEDSVFLRSFIPRTLNEVYDPERDVEKVRRGDTDGLIYAETIGLVSQSRVDGEDADDKQTTKNKDNGDRRTAIKFKDEETEEEQADNSGDETDSASMEDNDLEDEEEEGRLTEGFVERKPRGHRYEDKESKKERKKLVKAETKEKRKQKMPKAKKKRIVKKTKA